jgi:hypothetical protein
MWNGNSQKSIPLPVPVPTAPSTPPATEDVTMSPSAISINRPIVGPVSPPTPAPSPTFAQQWKRERADQVDHVENSMGKGKERSHGDGLEQTTDHDGEWKRFETSPFRNLFGRMPDQQKVLIQA